jgi:hypothetical protein
VQYELRRVLGVRRGGVVPVGEKRGDAPGWEVVFADPGQDVGKNARGCDTPRWSVMSFAYMCISGMPVFVMR